MGIGWFSTFQSLLTGKGFLSALKAGMAEASNGLNIELAGEDK